MFELISTSILGALYIYSLAKEEKELQEAKEQEKIRDLKIKLFCYAVSKKMLYNDVVKLYIDKKISNEDNDKELKTEK